VRGELEDAANKPTITGCVIAEYKKLCPGRPFVAFCVSVQHSRDTARAFNKAGVPCISLDGTTPTAERAQAMDWFRSGKTLGLCNCDLFGEGLDVPGIEAAILLRPTQSLSLYLQQVGRALRPKGGRTAIILDHAGNCMRHGLPDEPREWTLDDREKRKKGQVQVVSVKICPSCLAAQRPGSMACRYCTEPFPVEPREIREVDGHLVEVKKIERKKEQGKAQSMDELIELGRKRGYKNPHGWAYYIYNSRKNRRRAA